MHFRASTSKPSPTTLAGANTRGCPARAMAGTATAALVACIALALVAPIAHAQAAKASAQSATPPVLYWMDVATYSMMGMDELPEMDGMAGMMMGGMMGRTSMTGRDGRHAKGVGNFGQTKGMGGIGRQLDIALYTRARPAGTSATQQIPDRADVGANPLHLVTPPRESVSGSSDEASYPERPRGRILFYWGCSKQVKAGQPRILDMSKLSTQDYTNFMQGRSVKDRGARAEAGYAIWPNERENSHIRRDASLAGQHSLSGEGVPASMSFTLGHDQDFMPSLKVDSAGDLKDSVHVSWQTLPTARAYLLTAISGGKDHNDDPEMVIWSSSEPPESGFGLMDYVSNANIDKWLGEKVLLPAKQSDCDVPAGIFAKSEGAMLQAIAYGNELNIVHPPRPANPKTPWTPEWSVRVRNKSVAMNMLGQENADMSDGRSDRSRRNERKQRNEEERPGPGSVLRNLFKR